MNAIVSISASGKTNTRKKDCVATSDKTPHDILSFKHPITLWCSVETWAETSKKSLRWFVKTSEWSCMSAYALQKSLWMDRRTVYHKRYPSLIINVLDQIMSEVQALIPPSCCLKQHINVEWKCLSSHCEQHCHEYFSSLASQVIVWIVTPPLCLHVRDSSSPLKLLP